MSIFVDIAVIAVIALSIFMGYKKGLIGVAFKILSFFIAMILAFILSTPITNYVVENTQLDDTIHDTIQNALEAQEIENIDEQSGNAPEAITKYITDQIKEATAETQNEIASVVATNLTRTIVNAIVFIGIFLVARVALFFLRFLADAIAELPILKQFNKLGGVIYGILRGFFMIYLVFAILSLLSAVVGMGDLLGLIHQSFLGNMFYDNNLLLKLLF